MDQELINEFLAVEEGEDIDSECHCEEETMAELDLMTEAEGIDETPALSALEAEVGAEGQGIELLSLEALDEAGFEVELMIEGDDLLDELEWAVEEALEEDLSDVADLEMAQVAVSEELEHTGLDDLIEAARRNPGLKITLSF